MEDLLLVHLFFVGAVVVLSITMRYGAERVRTSPIVGYFALGILLRAASSFEFVPLLSEQQVFPFLADLGVIALLFRVGLESDLEGLLDQVAEAVLIGFGNVIGSGGLAFGTAYGLLGWPLLPSLFVATALTATSVGVTVALWKEADRLDSPEGSTLVDVAEFDDLLGVLLMALLFAAAPLLRGADGAADGALLSTLATVLGGMLLKLVLFGGACLLFACYVERPMTTLFDRLHAGEGTMLVMLGVGIGVAAAAGLMGFSTAIGAFFAGLLFCRDPHTTQYMAAFRPLHDLFAPFIFLSASACTWPRCRGRDRGGGPSPSGRRRPRQDHWRLPARPLLGSTGALVLGLSLVPRAEIALVIVQRGLELGPWALPSTIFAQVVLVSAATVLITPLVLRPLLAGPSMRSSPEAS
jgi:Kef-type K+ transport system membrane component KefB